MDGLRRDTSCHAGLSWRCSLEPGRDAETIVQGLEDAGFAQHVRAPGVLVFRCADEHEVVVVPRTGRVQIRVHYTVDPARRPAAAEGIAQRLDDAIGLSRGPP